MLYILQNDDFSTTRSPESFDLDALNKDTNGNWALAAGNLRKLMR